MFLTYIYIFIKDGSVANVAIEERNKETVVTAGNNNEVAEKVASLLFFYDNNLN